jgi:hypothetical protein
MPLFRSSDAAASFFNSSSLLSGQRGYSNPRILNVMDFITRQIAVLLDDYYVHLPLKRSSLGIDPIQEIKVLLDEISFIPTETEFYRRVIGIIKRLRDRHTAIRLPSPWRDAIAYLPFAIESYFTSGERGVLISKLMADLDDPNFTTGVEITHWNGVPIRNFIESFSWQTEGANPYARVAIALRFLTTRPLGFVLPPDEDWVTLTYVDLSGNIRSIVFPWRLYFPEQGSATKAAIRTPPSNAVLAQGLDRSTLIANNTWYDLYTKADAAPANQIVASPTWAGHMKCDIVHGRSGDVGYIRIFSFDSDDVPGFVQEVANLLKQMPKTGVIIDIRSNPGGSILVGEGLLGLFTTKAPEKEHLSFRNTAATRKIGTLKDFSSWRRSLEMQVSTGDLFSQGFSLGIEEALPRGVYSGRVVVIIDSLTYSTSDFFAAGMQDNSLATILGVDPVTGAGGANVWDHSTISLHVAEAGGDDISPMPVDFDINVAVRRSTRVGVHDGLPLEGLGVFADEHYMLTRDDVLGNNEGLLQFAANLLAAN